MNRKFSFGFIIVLVMVLTFSACNQTTIHSNIPQTQIVSNSEATVTITMSSSNTPSATTTPIPTETLTPTAIPTLEPTEPEGCLKPVENYELISINGMVINQRTLSMLEQAQTLYAGELDITGYHITQGSYSDQVSASFGTHAGGGAVDLSVIQYGTYDVLYDDIDPLIKALRTAGFAAWLRDFDQLYPGSPIHIHAIAIGDRDLSPSAQEQLTGEFGYFYGFNGIPQAEGFAPVLDEYGGPLICQWMIEMGYKDWRTPTP